jgi:nucleotide-binding universal stress UspA family protein
MSSFKHILVPTDFGEPAQAGLDMALSLASSADAKLTLFHAFTFLVPIYSEAAWVPSAELERDARQALDDALSKAKKIYPRAEGALGSGDPATEILRAATKLGVDLVVIGTHGRRGLSRVLLGSVAEKVVRLSSVPVLTVPGAADRKAKTAAAAQAGQ